MIVVILNSMHESCYGLDNNEATRSYLGMRYFEHILTGLYAVAQNMWACVGVIIWAYIRQSENSFIPLIHRPTNSLSLIDSH